MRWDAAFAKTGHCACCANGKPSSCSARGGYGNSPGAPTFTDVLILQPELPLDLPVGVPDGARLLKAIHGLLDVVVAKLVQQCHKVPAGGGPIQRVQCIAEGWGENMRGCSSLCRCRCIPGDAQPLNPLHMRCAPSTPAATTLHVVHPLLPLLPTCLHWEMGSWLSRTWYMTDCTFQCCSRGYPDTSLKFTIPAKREHDARTWDNHSSHSTLHHDQGEMTKGEGPAQIISPPSAVPHALTLQHRRKTHGLTSSCWPENTAEDNEPPPTSLLPPQTCPGVLIALLMRAALLK